jgi:pyridinium-3,5-biscarboxylic acid mononucleotide sulfurtransferase
LRKYLPVKTTEPHGNAEKKLKHLREQLLSFGSVLVAYSGGVDSTFLLKVAADTLGSEVLAVLAESPTLPAHDRADALAMIERLGARSMVIEGSEMANPAFVRNDRSRCYWCKRELFQNLKEIAGREGLQQVIEGSNSDDTSDYRPGLAAARELGIKSPLMEAGLTKDDIRVLSRELGLPTWDKPASACLSSRIAYGTAIQESVLQRIDAAEDILRSMGFAQVRVRHHGDVARIEVSEQDIGRLLDTGLRKQIAARLRELGYLHTAIDAEGYRCGSMNRALAPEARP